MALINLKDIYKDKGRSFIESLFTKYVIVSEQLDGSRITINRDENNCLSYCKKDGSRINFIDRTMMVFYETVFSHFEAMSMDNIIKMPENWIFGFQYFPSNAPVNITYDRTPQNGLILTDIQIVNQDGRVVKIISDPRVLSDWSNILQVEKPPVIFNGFLTSAQKERIMEYLSTPEKDLQHIFNSQSFTRYIISILNPDLRTSALMNDIDKPVEGIVFKFITPGENEVYSARLVDPIFQAHASNVKEPAQRKSSDMYQIAMLDIIEYLEVLNLDDIKLHAETPDERYIELICDIFNDYIKENGHKYVGVDFENPDFVKKPEFEMNMSTIPNERTREILRNDKLKDLFKIMLSSFRRYRKNPTPILTQHIIEVMNKIISNMQKKVEMTPEKDEVMDFNNYIKRDKIQGISSIFESIDNISDDDGEIKIMCFEQFISTGSTVINEAKEQLYPKEIKQLIALLESQGKMQKFEKFLNMLSPKARKEFIDFLSKICTDSSTKKLVPQLAEIFQKYKKIEDITKFDLNEGIFNLFWPKKLDGVGPGELLITWSIINAVVSGGSESFDIEFKGSKFEVKSLINFDTKGNIAKSPGSIDGAKYSDTSNYQLTADLQDFFKNVVDVYYENDLRDGVLSLSEDPKQRQSISALLDAFETIPTTTADGSKKLSSQITEMATSLFDKFYNGITGVQKYKSKVKDLSASSRLSIKSKTTDAQYWVEPDDVDKISKAAGTEADVNIKVGSKITDENKDSKIWFSKLLSNKFIKDPNYFTKSLSEIAQGFMEGKTGLIYIVPPGQIKIATSMSGFHTSYITRGKYRFSLNGMRAKGDYEYAKAQYENK
jgi:hypothetical protein